MLTSERQNGGEAALPDAYAAALAAFAAVHVTADGQEGLVQAYHAVRALPYRSGADRTPLRALTDGRGACTAKHLILRDLLRRTGRRADVEIVEGDFARAVPAHPTMPADLRAMIDAGRVRDFHCRVRAGEGRRAQRLDATWPDALRRYGFAVDMGWSGSGDTIQAMRGIVSVKVAEDVLAAKAALLATLTPTETACRAAFLRLVSDWMKREIRH